jgi:hypothetical protein
LLIIRLLSFTTRTPLMGPPLTCRGLDIRPASYASLHRPLMESRTTNDILLIRNDRYLGLPRSFECASFVGPRVSHSTFWTDRPLAPAAVDAISIPELVSSRAIGQRGVQKRCGPPRVFIRRALGRRRAVHALAFKPSSRGRSRRPWPFARGNRRC